MNRRWYWAWLAVITGGCASASPVSTETAATSPASVQKSISVAEPSPPTGMLLPRTALPTRYTVELALDNAETKVKGDIAIDLKLAEPTRVVWLHGRDLVVREAHFEVSGKSIAAQITPDPKGERLGFFTATTENLPAGVARLAVRFEAKVLENADRGIFREKEGNDFYIFSQFENTDARSAFPCFDEPNVKTPWDVTLDVPASQTALGNTHVVSETTPQNGRKKVKFAETQPLPAYLVAFAVGPFDLVDGGKAGKAKIPVRIAAPRGAGAEAAYAASITADLIGVLEEYFGIPFPYDKLDVVPVPTLITWGAMENAGLITFFREGMLARAGEDSETFKRRYADIMAHELAHQWFGDLVTMQWWDDIWLNEGFATWMTNKVVAKYKPDWNVDVSRVRDGSKAMVSDSLVSARRIRQPIETPDDIANAFDAITYEKGAAVLDMFEAWIGEEKFRRGIHDYLQKHAHGNATSKDFFAAISEQAGQDVGPAFSSFLDQPGVPLVAPASDCKANAPRVSVAQERYLPLGSQGDPKRTWIVPVCMRSAAKARSASTAAGDGGDQVCGLLKESKGEVPVPADACSTALVRNAGARGYYIASYTPEVLDTLFREGAKKLSPAERVAILRDVRALLVGGKLNAADVLARLARLMNDPDPSVVRGALGWLEEFSPAVVAPTVAPKFAAYVKKTLGSRARTLGFAPKPKDDPETRFLRPLLLTFVANRGEDPALIAEAKSRAKKWLAGDSTSTADEMIEAVLSISAAHGDKAFFDELHQAAKQTTDVKRRRRLLQAMSDFREPAIVEAAFKVALSGDFDIREALELLANDDEKMAPIVFRLMKQHYEELRTKLPTEVVGTLPEFIQGLCSDEERKEVETFFKERSSKELGGSRRLAHALEFISNCSAFRAYQEPSLAKFLAKG